MITKNNLLRTFVLITFYLLFTYSAVASVIIGKIVDATTKESLTGATVMIVGTSLGAAADIDGNYTLFVKNGVYTLSVKYIGYQEITIADVKVDSSEVTLDVEMIPESQTLNEVSVVARQNRESESALLNQREKASIAIENIGAKEMSIKGLANVQESVKKISGISIADAGQIIVRGLGDRYSTTTLNGLPIASPNPDNKLIPLDLFPSSTIQNITVSKVYDATSYADYSGAHIDICTKDNVVTDFVTLSIATGGKFNTIGRDRYQMDRKGTLFNTPSLDQNALKLSLSDYDEYVKSHDIFETSFNVSKKTAIPDLGGNFGIGKNFTIGNNRLSVLASLSINNEYQNIDDAYYKTLEASGNVQNDFSYDSYAQKLQIAGLGYLGYTFNGNDRIGYTFFYARNATDTYQYRTGEDAEGHNLIGSNNTTHIYVLQNHQLNGVLTFGDSKDWELSWGASYGITSSDEPDRRQVMYEQTESGKIELFKLNRQETMRYFGELNEDEWNGNVALKWQWNETNNVQAGINYKNKDRDYQGIRFYYNLNNISPEIESVYDTDAFLNMENVESGRIVIERKMQPKDSYLAGNDIYAGYVTSDYYPIEPLLINLGVRVEVSKQWVKYATDGGERYANRRDLDKTDLFPALNMKYTLNNGNSLRFAFSRTITRPSFIEMAPFLYQESYGSAQIRGNEELQNGYNYNADIRFEKLQQNGNMISVTGYFKFLDNPIERIQALQGGATLHSFRNANNGIATGVELELRQQIIENLKFGGTVSYMYTNVKLPEGGAYTNKERSLQGASPILVNADVTYTKRFGEVGNLDVALLYNLQGSRIHAVGVSQLGDIKQQTVHSLNFNASYSFNNHLSAKLQFTDLLNRDIVFKQEVPVTGEKIDVERYKKGIGFEIGITYKL